MNDQTSLMTDQRLAEIRARIDLAGRVVAGSLAAEFGVSEDTIRRDLRALAAQGHCERVYGGAIKRGPRPTTLARRMGSDQAEKRLLGQLAAALVQPGETIFIDAGSTNLEIARHLPQSAEITVVTNAPGLAAMIDGPEVVLIGGRYDQKLGACLGAATLRELGKLNPHRAFIGTCGITLEAGLTAFTSEEALLKQVVAERATSVCIALTREKLGLRAPFSICGIETLTHVAVSDPEHEICQGLSEAGVAILSPPAPKANKSA